MSYYISIVLMGVIHGMSPSCGWVLGRFRTSSLLGGVVLPILAVVLGYIAGIALMNPISTSVNADLFGLFGRITAATGFLVVVIFRLVFAKESLPGSRTAGLVITAIISMLVTIATMGGGGVLSGLMALCGMDPAHIASITALSLLSHGGGMVIGAATMMILANSFLSRLQQTIGREIHTILMLFSAVILII